MKALASRIGRTPSAVALKLVNFASLDPAIRSTGRKGMGNTSQLDREVWAEFNADWERSTLDAAIANGELGFDATGEAPETNESTASIDYSGSTKLTTIERRHRQDFFRNSVLSSYRSICCMSGASDPRVLIASHIVPWSEDPRNRLNPRNGLCLSAIHDKAYDRGLISVTPNFEIRLSTSFKSASKDEFLRSTFLPLEGKKINLPEKFRPDPAFLVRHFDKWLLGE